jgi:hypothetical protein
MHRKPNYRLERAERNRAKEAKKEEKLKRRQERLSSRAGEEPADATAEAELGEEARSALIPSDNGGR